MALVLKQHLKVLILVVIAFMTFACRAPESQRSTVKWGVHQMGSGANILNLLPNQSIEICAPSDDWLAAAKSAIQQWATPIGRWGHFEIKPCNSSSNLVINMQGFGQAGLNYFTDTPGRIYIQSNATGNMLKALILHEYGHSFGLCDQYMDAGSASCSSTADRQDNSEIMGATSPDKQKLTAGDIDGVKAASKINIRANKEWDSFLATNPQTQNPQNPTPQTAIPVYARIQDGATANGVLIYVSVPVGTVPVLCLNRANQVPCAAGAASAIALAKFDTAGDRDIYKSVAEVTTLLTSSKNIFETAFAVQGQNHVGRFAVASKN